MRRIISVIAVLLSMSCQGYPFSYVNDAAAVVGQSGTTITASSSVDILFVVDNSGSMLDKQDNLRRNAAGFIQEFTKTNLDYHLGVVTTDMFAVGDGGALRMAPSANNPQPYWVGPAATDADLTSKRQAIVDGFEQTIASLGTQGNLNEAGFLAVLKAVNPTDPVVKQRNAGFIRPTADLAVIILTDEDDCSFTPNNFAMVSQWVEDTNCYVKTDALYDTGALVTLFGQLKGGDLGKVRLGIIAGGIKPAQGQFEPRGCIIDSTGAASDACGCWQPSSDSWFCASAHQDFNQPCVSTDGCTATNTSCASVAGGVCDTTDCHSTPARRYDSFVKTFSAERQALGYDPGAFIDTVCQNEFSTTLLTIAHDIVLSNCFTLPSKVLDPNDIQVTIARHESSGDIAPPQVVKRYSSSDPSAACQSCGECTNNAWELSADGASACLACNTTALEGDKIRIGVLSQTNASTTPGASLVKP